jgi:hypothetical protein
MKDVVVHCHHCPEFLICIAAELFDMNFNLEGLEMKKHAVGFSASFDIFLHITLLPYVNMSHRVEGWMKLKCYDKFETCLASKRNKWPF